jgi:argininosuccinate lyase
MEQKIIDLTQGKALLKALNDLRKGLKLRSSIEDVHMCLEEEVIKRVGLETGGNLHIAKSRNDQVSTAIRMKLREDLLRLMAAIMNVQKSMINLAEKHVKTVIPGYTHLQPAQPITFAHYILSHLDALERNVDRIEDAYDRVNICPMGACALATTSFPINRDRVAELLGFNEVLENSIDAVSSRDFILETLAVLAIVSVDVSRLVEDLIIWNSTDFGIIELPDAFSGTSSIMPQKKNPEVLEVIRARMSRNLGNFITSTAAVKALPSGYNLDFQEITPILWESIENTCICLNMLSKVIINLKVNENLADKMLSNFSTSTELANILTRKYGVPFRTAHKIIGFMIKRMIENKLTFHDITPGMLHEIAKESSGLSLHVSLEDLHACINPMKFVEAHNVKGGPSPAETERMIKIRIKKLDLTRNRLSEKKRNLTKARKKLNSTSKLYLLGRMRP